MTSTPETMSPATSPPRISKRKIQHFEEDFDPMMDIDFSVIKSKQLNFNPLEEEREIESDEEYSISENFNFQVSMDSWYLHEKDPEEEFNIYKCCSLKDLVTMETRSRKKARISKEESRESNCYISILNQDCIYHILSFLESQCAINFLKSCRDFYSMKYYVQTRNIVAHISLIHPMEYISNVSESEDYFVKKARISGFYTITDKPGSLVKVILKFYSGMDNGNSIPMFIQKSKLFENSETTKAVVEEFEARKFNLTTIGELFEKLISKKLIVHYIQDNIIVDGKHSHYYKFFQYKL